MLNDIYTNGVSDEIHAYGEDKLVYLKNGNEVNQILYSQIFKKQNISEKLNEIFKEIPGNDIQELLEKLLLRTVTPNVSLNTALTEATVATEISEINPNRGIIEKGGRIIAKGEVVEGDKFQILNSLKDEYQSQVWSKSNYVWLLVGYSLLVSLVFLMLYLFLKKYRPQVFNNNTKVTFIFFNVVLMVFLTTIVVKMDSNYVYVVPLCILPIVIKAFFDPRLGLFVHVLTLLLLGFVVPNSFEYLFLQIIPLSKS